MLPTRRSSLSRMPISAGPSGACWKSHRHSAIDRSRNTVEYTSTSASSSPGRYGLTLSSRETGSVSPDSLELVAETTPSNTGAPPLCCCSPGLRFTCSPPEEGVSRYASALPSPIESQSLRCPRNSREVTRGPAGLRRQRRSRGSKEAIGCPRRRHMLGAGSPRHPTIRGVQTSAAWKERREDPAAPWTGGSTASASCGSLLPRPTSGPLRPRPRAPAGGIDDERREQRRSAQVATALVSTRARA